ncbi:hypothetical protein V475_06325 [Sphingobium baderi LL03]|uniref:Uncharacterized protein n=1 Tax=Sphingobium baderi LL03 TaxID=1114964 RepID=T0H2A3_9SPHN|nr:hypothetical protein L485_00845 [Sphingobium baderi LL03]KMS62784.1 hypothetical protein V475_06325 [Sphingobium baderi LL03]
MRARKHIIQVLEVTASNIRSLGPAGALSVEPYRPYQIWLAEVEAALAAARGDRKSRKS